MPTFMPIFMLALMLITAATAQTCRLWIPDDPLSAPGLAIPYRLLDCSMADTPAFVQASILDHDTGFMSVYSPLVINDGTLPGAPPVVPVLPQNRTVGLWFGSNADVLVLENDLGLRAAECVNGIPYSPFGQFAYCNAPRFFAEIHRLGRHAPPLGIAMDGLPCPTSTDFFIVDADPNDNLQTTYLLLPGARTAQNTVANRQRFTRFRVLENPSDEALLTESINPAVGCESLLAPDLADPGQRVASLALNEIQALLQGAPAALIPAGNPMTLVDGRQSLEKLNLYRLGVNQPRVQQLRDASTTTFCDGLVRIGGARIADNKARLSVAPSPAPDVATNLFTFLANRLSVSFELLKCKKLLGVRNPVSLTRTGNIVSAATIAP